VANPLKDIERDFDVGGIITCGEKAWPVLRWSYFDAIRTKGQPRQRRVGKIGLLGDCFYGAENWLSGADVLCFSDSEMSTRRHMQGEYYDRFIDPIIDAIGVERCLLIETPSPRHRPRGVTHTKKIISSTPFEVKARILARLKGKILVENQHILNAIQEKYGISIDDEKILRLYHARKTLYHILYRRINPKAIFMVEYYRDVARVKAAKELGIQTIEVQHGIIGTEHPAYNSAMKIDAEYYPDQLLAFGETERNIIDGSFIFKKEQIHPVGSYIIDYVNELYKPDAKLLEDIRRYDRSVAVTLQKTVTEETMGFIAEAARSNEKILYLIIPRQEMSPEETLPSNIRIVTDPNFYELMKYVDIHVTAYSSCAIEAPSMGVRNLLINIGGYAKSYYGHILRDEIVTRYVETPRELVDEIMRLPPVDKKGIIEANAALITPRYRNNLLKYLRGLNLMD
jgi:hypothetical protein